MIVDTSALVAIVFAEQDAGQYSAALVADERVAMSAASWLETAIVVDAARDPAASRKLDMVVESAEIELVPVSVEQARIARQAYRDFGKGSGHPARLNFGDCFAYALAADTRQPLLFKGDDFVHTDVSPALPPPAGSG